jgi:7,8-dihydropterin-6-yl-methyl-4-(beta-D-ribofuranosyl)aminobenzene 5'-phosphate synthase
LFPDLSSLALSEKGKRIITLKTKSRGLLFFTLMLAVWLTGATIGGCSGNTPASSTSFTQPTTTTTSRETTQTVETTSASELKLTILYDNNKFDPQLETKWGFACLVEMPGKVILFDTGGDGATLLENMSRLRLDPSIVDVIVISHNHSDHIGGLMDFLEANSQVLVYLPASIPEGIKDNIAARGAAVETVSDARMLFPGAYTTGELGSGIYEQALIMTTRSGMIVLTGCAHPGVANIVSKASDLLPGMPIYLLLGGFHMDGESAAQIKRVVDAIWQAGVVHVSPCHCSGEDTQRIFREKYCDHYIAGGIGRKVQVPDCLP